jgi:hypothetical protein
MTPLWKRESFIIAVLIIGAVAYSGYNIHAGPKPNDDVLLKLQADMKKTLPKKINEITTLEDVRYEHSKTSYWFTVDTQGAPFVSHLIEQTVRERACANKGLARMMNETGFTYEYHYVNKEQQPLAIFTIAKCP